jgi:iron complex outermembrane recepter protein
MDGILQGHWAYRRIRLAVRHAVLALLVGSSLGSMQLAAGDEPATLDEVIVTAQRRSETAQSVPISLAVFDETLIGRAAIVDIDGVASRTPGFTLGRFNIGEPQLFIRGVGSTSDSAAGDPSVGIFLDDIYIGRVSGASFDLFDIERIEVLRGPQGTLYGRNTVGGAINIVPNHASRDVAANSRIELGNYETYAVNAMVNGPVGERSAVRLAGSHRQHSGYSSNILTGSDLDDANVTGARLSWNTELSDSSRVRFTADRVRDRNGGNARVPGPVFTDQTGVNAVALAALLRIWPLDSDARKAYSDPDSYQHRDITGIMGRLDAATRYGEWQVLASWRSVDLDWFEDLDALKPFGSPPLPGVPPSAYGWVISSKDRAREEAGQYSLEARLVSPDSAARKWVVGASYAAESVERTERFITRFSLIPAATGDVTFGQDADNESAALYGQLTMPIISTVSITGGLRYTRDTRDVLQTARNNDEADPTPGIPLFPGQEYRVIATDAWQSLTGKLAVEYHATAANLFYASASSGYKAGIFPSQNNVVQNVGIATSPEKVRNYELGAKTDWLDRRLRFNLALFRMDYDDLQLFRLDPQLRVLTFTEDADIEGVETELQVMPSETTRIALTYAHLDAQVVGGSNSGDSLPRAPRHRVGAQVERDWTVGPGIVSMRVEYQWTDSFSTEVPNSRVAFVPDYGLLDARFGYLWPSGVDISVWGKNLTDETYATHITPFLGNGFSLFGPPRTYGVSIGWRLQ